MPIKIENISENIEIAPNVYSVRINDELVACFTHDRELGLAECLRAAARACEGIKERKDDAQAHGRNDQGARSISNGNVSVPAVAVQAT